jgi:hypothetical protein
MQWDAKDMKFKEYSDENGNNVPKVTSKPLIYSNKSLTETSYESKYVGKSSYAIE